MYEKIYEFANAKGLTIKENRKSSKIAAYIVLDSNGDYQGIEVIAKDNIQTKEIPDFGSFSRVEKQPNPICEKIKYILDKTEKKYPYWVLTMLSGDEWCDSLKTLSKFINRYDTDDIFASKVYDEYKQSGLKPDDVVSFRIDGAAIEDLNDWENWLRNCMQNFNAAKGRTEANESIISSITGDLQESVPAKSCPEIKNVPNDIKAAFGIGSGVYIAAMKENSYQSYGFDGAVGSQMGLEDAKTICAGFEYLLSNSEHRNKDFGIIYFYDNPDVQNLIDEALEQGDDDLAEELAENRQNNNSVMSNIFEAIRTGVAPKTTCDDCNYYMAKFNVPSRSRFYLSHQYSGSYKSLQDSLYKWYDDTHIVRYERKDGHLLKHDYCIRKIYSALLNCINNLGSNHMSQDVETEFGNTKVDFLRAVYTGKQIPRIYYDRAILHSQKTLVKGGSIRRVWIQLIKCYLRREGVNIMPELTENVGQAYACGRLFAVYEQMQWLYSGKSLNKNLSQTYFKSVMNQPGVFFPKIAERGIVYMGKIKNQVYYKTLLGEISEEIGTSFPKSFDKNQRGEFILGYYQQQADFIKQSAMKKESANEQNAENIDFAESDAVENVDTNTEMGE